MIPIFPLPNVVLFPHVFLPLHIFEDRYRAMVRDALDGDRIIGMVLMRQTEGELTPDIDPPRVYDVGCSGLITHCDPLADGRFNIVLRGLEKFRILEEDHTGPYRRALTESLPEPTPTGDRVQVYRERLEKMLDAKLSAVGSEVRPPREMADDHLVNALSQYLELDPLEKQALLERDGPLDRCVSLTDLLEMKAMMQGSGPSVTTVQ